MDSWATFCWNADESGIHPNEFVTNREDKDVIAVQSAIRGLEAVLRADQ